MIKYGEGLTEGKLDQKLEEIGDLLPKENEITNMQQVIVDGYIFEIDKSVPKIIKYIGKAEGVIITSTISGGSGWVKPGGKATLTGTIKSYSGATITKVSATQNGTEITNFALDGDRYKIENITTDTTFIIKGEDSRGNKKEKEIQVNIKIDGTAPTIEKVIANIDKRKITISAMGNDKDSNDIEQSGINKFYYTISPSNGIPKDKIIGEFILGEKVEIESAEAREYTITVSADDKVGNSTLNSTTVDCETIGTIKHIKTSDGLKEINAIDIYGATVLGYTCDRTDVEWQIFYIDDERDDDNRVYLISKDNVVPPTTNTELEKYDNTEFPKAYRYNRNVINKYLNKTIPNTSFTEKFLSDYVNVTTSKNNLSGVYYMLNQEIWSEYMNNNKAEFVLGGPTLPIFASSINDICNIKSKIYYQKSTKGYKVRKKDESLADYTRGLWKQNMQEGIYFKKSGTEGYWLASPNDKSDDSLYYSHEGGELWYNAIWGTMRLGFRPLICLNSNTIFKDNLDGTYTIID